MFCLLFIIMIELSFFEHGSTYVLVQVRKHDGNHSNVDALIHKVVPSRDLDKFTHNIVRKQFSRKEDQYTPKDLENVVFAIESDTLEETSSSSGRPDIVDNIVKTVKDYLGGKPEFRSKESKSLISEPEIVHFRSDKPSMVFEVNTDEVVKALTRLLSSQFMDKIIDNISKGAAVVYT